LSWYENLKIKSKDIYYRRIKKNILKILPNIDLLIERKDKVINLCEMKYASEEFVIDKNYDEILRNKRGIFRIYDYETIDYQKTNKNTCTKPLVVRSALF